MFGFILVVNYLIFVCNDIVCFCVFFFFFKQKTAYEMRISDWSSDVLLFRSRVGACRADPSGLRGGGAGEQLLQGALLGVEDVGEEIGRASCRERVCQYV